MVTVRNDMDIYEGSKMRSVGLSEIKFELQIIQMMHFIFAKKLQTLRLWNFAASV